MKYLKRMTFEEWERFNVPAYKDRPSVSTKQEILLSKYKIIITNHITKNYVWVKYPGQKRKHRVKVPPLCEIPLSEKLRNLPSKFTQENFDKGMAKFDKGMTQFNKAVQTFSSGMGEFEKDMKRDEANLKKLRGSKSSKTTPLWSSKKSSTKIWGDKPKRRRKKKSSKPSNVDILWGKKK